jgi:hypothetical protein
VLLASSLVRVKLSRINTLSSIQLVVVWVYHVRLSLSLCLCSVIWIVILIKEVSICIITLYFNVFVVLFRFTVVTLYNYSVVVKCNRLICNG